MFLVEAPQSPHNCGCPDEYAGQIDRLRFILSALDEAYQAEGPPPLVEIDFSRSKYWRVAR
jgi:hypothetical protein